MFLQTGSLTIATHKKIMQSCLASNVYKSHARPIPKEVNQKDAVTLGVETA